ncbi:HPr kinase/phosphorylase [Humitalea sp. 24SJ18S-53]|uniref:HPr kinase/phosphorylase n=1 Tax=Humitalea sp. 24SJ18S-53 TaxID=3422307 RepID=UPI003D6780FE
MSLHGSAACPAACSGATRLHGSAAAWNAEGVLLLGRPGAGKSDLVLRLLDHGFRLVADDQVVLSDRDGIATADAPDALAGMLEVRGLGLLTGLAHGPAAIRLVVDCVERAEEPRLPEPRDWTHGSARVPRVALHAIDSSAPQKVMAAMDCLAGRRSMVVGAFAA